MPLAHVAGNTALDFVGTLSGRGTSDTEGLTSVDALATWYVDAGLVDRAPVVDEAQLAAALRLREHVYLLVDALVDGTDLPELSRLELNGAARRRGPTQTVGPDGRRVRRGDAEACLAAVAQSAVDLFGRDDGAVVRFCADDRCNQPFLDRSRGKVRRWCDMKTCGDRAKVRRYRSSRPVDRSPAIS